MFLLAVACAPTALDADVTTFSADDPDDDPVFSDDDDDDDDDAKDKDVDLGDPSTGDDDDDDDDDVIDPEVCYPGPNEAWDLCYPLFVGPSPYSYPSPLNGSPQYAPPTAYLDLHGIDGDDQLAPNFRLDEIAQTWKGQYAVVQPHAVDKLQGLRDALGPLAVNSGYRSPVYNDSVDGATHSRHMYGDAFDLDPVDVSLSTLADTCYAHGAGYVGVYTGHIHCDWRDDTVDAEFFQVWRSNIETPLPHHDARILDDGIELSTTKEGWDEGEPLRTWRAYDVDGVELEAVTADTYVPPLEAVEVEVEIGLLLTRTVWL